jgi:hypothetical protein
VANSVVISCHFGSLVLKIQETTAVAIIATIVMPTNGTGSITIPPSTAVLFLLHASVYIAKAITQITSIVSRRMI